MHIRSHRHARAITSAIWVACFLALAQTSGAQGHADPTETARQILLAIYPELAAAAYTVRVVTPDDTPLNAPWSISPHLTFEVRDPVDLLNPNRPRRLLFVGTFTFAADSGRLIELSVKGEYTHTSTLEGLCNLIDEHPEWSDERILAEGRAVGAIVFPRESADFAIATTMALEPFIGAVTIKSTFFGYHPVGAERCLLLAGALRAETAPADVTPSKYHLVFEPFDGKLISIQGERLKWPDPCEGPLVADGCSLPSTLR
jgi:hypothetical protein